MQNLTEMLPGQSKIRSGSGLAVVKNLQLHFVQIFVSLKELFNSKEHSKFLTGLQFLGILHHKKGKILNNDQVTSLEKLSSFF